MESAGLIEILDRRGRVRDRVRLEHFPVTFGRGYRNDVILDDRYVCSEHAWLLETDRGLVLEDLNSINGIQTDDRRRVRRLELRSGTNFRLGHTRMRYVAPGHAVEPAAPDRASASVVERLVQGRGVRWSLIGTGAAGILLALFLEDFQEFKLSRLATQFSPFLFLYAAWAGVWSLSNRVVSHEFRFSAHLAVIFGLTMLYVILEIVLDYFSFLFSPDQWYQPAVLVTTAVLTVYLIYAHLSVIGAMPPRRKFGYAATVTLVIYAFAGLQTYVDRSEFSSSVEFPAELRPIPGDLLVTRSLDRFFAGARSLQPALDTQAENAQ